MNRARRGAAAALVLLAVCLGTIGAAAHASGPASNQSVEAGRTWARTPVADPGVDGPGASDPGAGDPGAATTAK